MDKFTAIFVLPYDIEYKEMIINQKESIDDSGSEYQRAQ